MEWIIQLAISFLGANPILGTFLMVMGIMRVAMKPLMTLIQTIAANTETKADDVALDSFLNSPLYKAIAWFIDYVGSIKLPKAQFCMKQELMTLPAWFVWCISTIIAGVTMVVSGISYLQDNFLTVKEGVNIERRLERIENKVDKLLEAN